jgi:hypothetical protein
MKITKTSTFTGKEHTMDLPITQAEIDRWQSGELIQNVWPELKPHQREFMINRNDERLDKLNQSYIKAKRLAHNEKQIELNNKNN